MIQPSKITQWLLKGEIPLNEEEKSALSILSKTYPYFVPSKYVEAAAYNAQHSFAPAILNKMQLYMGDWYSFHEFLQQNNQVATTAPADGNIRDYDHFDDAEEDKPEYFFDTYDEEQEAMMKEDAIKDIEVTLGDDDDELDFDLFNEKEEEAQSFSHFDKRKESHAIPTINTADSPKEDTATEENQERTTDENDLGEAAATEQETVKTKQEILSEEKEETEEVIATSDESIHSTIEEGEPDTEIITEENTAAASSEQIHEKTLAEALAAMENKKEDIFPAAKKEDNPIVQPIYTDDYFLHQGIEVAENMPEKEAEDEAKSLMVVMSFSEWLMHFKTKTDKQKEEEADQKALKTMWQKEKLAAALEEENEEIPEGVFEMAVNSIKIEEDLMSESLAEILVKQGKYDKAIDMYKKLSLRNPKKNTYFASKIEKIIKEK